MTSSLVSIITPCYKQAHFLGEAIESLLAQTYQDFEIVVIDDGSPDNVAEVAARYPKVRYVRKQNGGLPEARNTGLRESRGDYIVLLDSDDRLLPNALELGLENLQKDARYGFAYGRCRLMDADGAPLPQTSPVCVGEQDHYAALLRRNDIWMPGQVMFRRMVFDKVGGLIAKFDHGSDYELYLRITRQFPAISHDQIVAEWRQHGTNATRNAEGMFVSASLAHRAQRDFIKANKQYEQAYRDGAREVQEYFGERVVSKILANVNEGGDRAELMKSATVLLRYAPNVFFKHVKRKLAVTVSGKGGRS